MKWSHLFMVGVLALPAAYVNAQAPAPAQQQLTAEQQAELDALKAALDAAATPEQKQQILSDAIAQNPALASVPALSGRVQSIAISSGMSIVQIDNAVITGLANAQAPAAGGQQTGGVPQPQFTPPQVTVGSTGGGGSTASGG